MFSGQRYCLLHLIKQKHLLKSYLRNLTSIIYLANLKSNLKLNDILLTPKMVKKVICFIESDFDEVSAWACMYISWSFEYVFKRIFSLDFWNASMLQNIGERIVAKTYCPMSLLSAVSKIIQKPVNKKHVNHLEKCDLFSDLECSYRSVQLQIFCQFQVIHLMWPQKCIELLKQ